MTMSNSNDVYGSKNYKTKNFSYQVKKNKVYITNYIGKSKKIIIPANIKKKQVVSATIKYVDKKNKIITKKAKYLKSLTIKGYRNRYDEYVGGINKLDLTKNKQLEVLNIKYLGKSIKLKNNRKLKKLTIIGIKSKKTLNLTKNSRLETLKIKDSKIATLNVKNAKSLKKIKFDNVKLGTLYAGNNNMSNLSIGMWNDEDEYIEKLDLGNNPQLKKIDVACAELSSVNISGCKNLHKLNLPYNKLKTIDLTNNKNLTYLRLDGNLFSDTLNLLNNKQLTELSIDCNKIKSLNLSANKNIKVLSCKSNYINDLDLTQNTALEYIDCAINQLNNLNIDGLKKLDQISFQYNPNLSVDTSTNFALTQVEYSPSDENTNDETGTIVKIRRDSPIVFINGKAKHIGYLRQ